MISGSAILHGTQERLDGTWKIKTFAYRSILEPREQCPGSVRIVDSFLDCRRIKQTTRCAYGHSLTGTRNRSDMLCTFHRAGRRNSQT